MRTFIITLTKARTETSEIYLKTPASKMTFWANVAVSPSNVFISVDWNRFLRQPIGASFVDVTQSHDGTRHIPREGTSPVHGASGHNRGKVYCLSRQGSSLPYRLLVFLSTGYTSPVTANQIEDNPSHPNSCLI